MKKNIGISKSRGRKKLVVEPPPCSTVGCENTARFEYEEGWLSCLTCAKKDMEKGKLTKEQALIVAGILATEMTIH